jgi:O-antigen/teichoic acid export membrane protein
MVGKRNTVQLVLEISKLFLLVGGYLYICSENRFDHRISLGLSAFIYALSAVVGLVFSLWFLRKHISQFMVGSLRPPRELWVNGFWAQNGQLVQFLNYRLALLFISKYVGLEETGVYSNALLMADTIWIFGNSFGTIAHMRMIRSENPKFRADITIRYASISLVGTLVACLILAAIPNGVYTGIFGSDFLELKQTFLYLIPAILALGLSTVFSHYLHATNQFKTLLAVNISGLAMQIGLGFLLIPKWGLHGACVAADAGFITLLIAVLLVFRRQNPGAKLHGVLRFSTAYKIAISLFR